MSGRQVKPVTTANVIRAKAGKQRRRKERHEADVAEAKGLRISVLELRQRRALEIRAIFDRLKEEERRSILAAQERRNRPPERGRRPAYLQELYGW